MGKGRATSKRTAGRQALARRNVLDYVRRLGLRKAANKLSARVADLRRWLDEGFPTEKLDRAIGLATPGGTHVGVRGSSLATLVKQVGKKAAAELTGLAPKKLNETLKKTPGAKVVINRKKLASLVKKEGAKGAAAKLGAEERAIKGATRPVLTKQSRALGQFAKKNGVEATAAHLGISAKQLNAWITKGVPRAWESDVGAAIASTAGRAFNPKHKRNVEAEIRAALSRTKAWNRNKPKRSQIPLATAERWARLGVYENKYGAVRDAFLAAKAAAKKKPSKKPAKPTKRPAPPPPVPPKPDIPDVALPIPPTPPPGYQAPPPAPPPPPEPPRPPLPEEWKQNFLQARYEAMLESQQGQRLPQRSYKPPPIPIGRIKEWKLVNRHGVHVFRRVNEFVSDLDLKKVGSEIARLALEVWKRLATKDSRAFMLITLTFSVMGDGHPFYPDAFVEGDSVNFVIKNLQIYNDRSIDRDVRALMRDIYEIDSEVTPLYLEHYEISKSTPNT